MAELWRLYRASLAPRNRRMAAVSDNKKSNENSPKATPTDKL
jgi:hypothetical protein